MIGLPSQGRIFLRRSATDMRNSLSGLVRGEMDQEPMSGDVYVFVNRCRDLVKVLYWDRDGFAVWAKRLERGRFSLPVGQEPEVDRAGLAMLWEGVKAEIVFRSSRWKRGS